MVDIIIITYNSEKTIAKCLQSIFSQQYPLDKLKIIIIDNNSYNGTVNVIKNLASKDLTLKIFTLKHNIGFAKAVKFALKFSNAKYVLLLNPDAIMPDDYIKTLVNMAEQLCTFKIGVLEGVVKKGNIVISDGAFFDPLTGFDWSPRWKNHLPPRSEKPIEIRDYVPFTAALVRRELLELLDEHYFLYNEDLDFAQSIRQKGYYCAVTLQTYAEHEVELRKRKLSELRVYYHIKGRLYLLQKRLPYPFLLTSLLTWIIVLPLTLLFVNRRLARVSVLAVAHFFKERRTVNKHQGECKIVLPLRTLTALKHIVKHIAYGGHSW